ncbi:hypothetical protein B0J12DRAFT_684233 [Macrophomina phaseolina]|uniref:Rhodopsin domain-containing protein n=1 Tax=Macrophomina phaseolina TaxID=35725 RepID=A0ABQ8FUJ5_9PEZI|nr:hypothetical protein B0J12DRAFT_684233 [Macrophomina phaseolina]
MANTVPPGPDNSIASQLLIPCGILQALVCIIYIARMHARFRPVRTVWWDDYTISVAVALSIVGFSLQIAACKHGMGRHNYYVPSDDQSAALHYLFVMYCTWVFCVGLIRLSVAFLLLRFFDTPAWRWSLRILVASIILSIIGGIIAQLIECRPLRAMWEAVADAKCWTNTEMQIFGYVQSIITIIQDCVLSLIPIAFLKKLRRPLAERIVVACLMALGLTASAAAIIKLSHLNQFGITGDTLRDLILLNKWSKIEEQLGIVATCIPPLKSSVERVLRRLGLPTLTDMAWSSDFSLHLSYGTDRFYELDAMRRYSNRVNSVDGEQGMSGSHLTCAEHITQHVAIRTP